MRVNLRSFIESGLVRHRKKDGIPRMPARCLVKTEIPFALIFHNGSKKR